jgi:hypothetical protein
MYLGCLGAKVLVRRVHRVLVVPECEVPRVPIRKSTLGSLCTLGTLGTLGRLGT